MKTTPFNQDFRIDSFVITLAIIDAGYYPLSYVPELETVKFLISNEFNIIYPQYTVVEVDEDLLLLFPDVSVGTYVLTWLLQGSSSSSECDLPDPILGLEGGVYNILLSNIGETAHIRYVSQ